MRWIWAAGAAALTGICLISAPRIHDRLCGEVCFQATRPAPYADADYFSKEFLAEKWNYPGPEFGPDGALFVRDFRGKWLNARNGHRVTPAPSSERANDSTLYVLGGSTVECREVPDGLTLPSQLQTALQDGRRVENYGYSGASIEHQLEKLRTLPIKRGDVVIFYDGVNDALSWFLAGKSVHSLDDDAGESLAIGAFDGITKPVLTFLKGVRKRLSNHPFFETLFGGSPTFLLQNFIPPQLRSEDRRTRLGAALRQHVVSELTQARDYVVSKKARFIHFFQPVLGDDPLSSYERDLEARPAIVQAATLLSLREARTVFNAADAELRKAGVESVSLNHVLAGRLPGDEVFLDVCHLNHVGNRMVASRIAQEIRARGW